MPCGVSDGHGTTEDHHKHVQDLIDPAGVRPEPQHNHLLAALSPEVQSRLFSHLELVPLSLGSLLYESGRAMRRVYFPTDSIISLQYMMQNGDSTAILVVGNEGLLGYTLFMGEETTRSRSLVQSAGHAFRLPRARVKEEFSRHGELLLLLLLLRYTQAPSARWPRRPSATATIRSTSSFAVGFCCPWTACRTLI